MLVLPTPLLPAAMYRIMLNVERDLRISQDALNEFCGGAGPLDIPGGSESPLEKLMF